MARSADADRVAGVPKVERPDAQDSEAAKAAERIDPAPQPSVDEAKERAEALENQPDPDEETVQVKPVEAIVSVDEATGEETTRVELRAEDAESDEIRVSYVANDEAHTATLPAELPVSHAQALSDASLATFERSDN